MSMDPYEAEQEDAYLALYEEHAKMALAEFQIERLSSFYRENREVAKSPVLVLKEARELRGPSPSASLVLASSASEVGVKLVLLRPVVVGLVHTEALADHIAEVVMAHQALDRFKDLLFAILGAYAGIDLATHLRAGASKPIWEEVKENIARRNALLHRCESATPEAADIAIAVASEILEVLFPALVGRLGFHLHDGYRICADYHFPPEVERLFGRNAAA